jgi:hypothetical protein
MGSFAQRAIAGLGWYEYFEDQLQSLVPQFGLDQQRNQMLACFELIFRESIATSCEHPPTKFSRINFDGLPIQYSVSLSQAHASLQFLGEVGKHDATNLERLHLARVRIISLLELLKISVGHEWVLNLIDQMAPEADPDLVSDRAGALWLSPTFSRNHNAKLTIYFNNSWGTPQGKVLRLGHLASHIEEHAELPELLELAKGVMEPLGASLTLSADAPPCARMYLRAFGKEVSFYHGLVKKLTPNSFQSLFERFLETMLREDCSRPTQSVVCSVGLGKAEESDFKFELCCHCALASDAETKARCLQCLQSLSLDPKLYLILLDRLAGNALLKRGCEAHVYVALGLKDSQPYTSIYLKPHIRTFNAGS